MAANNSYEEATAMIAAANKVVQDPNSVGAALRTISLRLRGTSTKELSEAGEETEGVITSKSKLRGKVKTLSGVDILTETGEYKSTYEILLEISKVWEDMSDIDQAALLEVIAGKTRSNTAAAILSNQLDLENAYTDALNAEGSAWAENEKYLDSIQGKLDLFNNSIQTMWNNALNDEVIKVFITIATKLVEIVDNVGLLKTAFMGFGTYLTTKYFKGDLIGGLFGKPETAEKSILQIKKELNDLATARDKAVANAEGSFDPLKKLKAKRAENKYDTFKKKADPITKEYDDLTAKMNDLESQRSQLLSGVDESLDVSSDEFKQAIRNNVESQLQIDTSTIDTQIEDINNKLLTANDRLETAVSRANKHGGLKRGRTTPNRYDRRQSTAQQEVDQLQVQLASLQQQRDELISSVANPEAEGVVNKIKEINKEIEATKVKIDAVTKSEEAAAAGGTSMWKRIGIGAKNARKAVWAYGKQIAQSMLTMYAITTVMELIGKVGEKAWDWLDGKNETLEEAQEAFEKSKSELEENESELKNLNTELDSTQDKIDELMSQGTLTFTEQEELNRLKEQNAELKQQIELRETLQKTLQQGVNANSVNATNKYLAETSFGSEKTKSERQEEAKETGSTIGKIAGAIIGTIIGAGITVASGGTLAVAGFGLGSLVGGAIGGAVGSAKAGSDYDTEQSVEDAIKNIQLERQKLIDAQNEALASGDTESYNEATEALNNYDSQMSKHISLIQENYNAMDWDTASTDQKEAMRQQADMLSAYAIAMKTSGAISSTISRIFGEEATDGLEKVKKAWEENTDKTKDFGDILKETLSPSEYDAFLNRLHDMGLYVVDLESYFKEVEKAEEDALSDDLSSVADDINKVSDALSTLKSAFDEINEKGFLTVSTFESLKDKFADNSDALAKYANVVLSGVASTEEMIAATEELAKAYIDDKLLNGGEVTALERIEYIVQLKDFGVTNAEEYVDDRIRENMYKEIAQSATYNYDNIKTGWRNETGKTESDYEKALADGTIDAWARAHNYVKEISQEDAQEIIDRYGIEVDSIDTVIDKLEELANAESNLKKAQDEKGEYDTWIKDYKSKLEEINSLKKDETDFQGYYNFSSGLYGKVDKDGERKTFDQVTQISDSREREKWIANDDGTYSIIKEDTIILEEEYQKRKEKLEQLKELQTEFDKLQEEGKEKGWINENDSLAEGVDKSFEDAYNAAKEGKEKLEKEIETELTADVKLKLELQDKSKLVDDIQSVFDTLASAQKEYSENGYLSVDTMQSLLELEPKYLSLLYDENGNLNLNKQALYDVAKARITEMGLKSLETIATNALTAIQSGNIEVMKDQIEVMETATDKLGDYVAMQMVAIDGALALKVQEGTITKEFADSYRGEILSQMNNTVSTIQSALDNLPNTLTSGGNTAKSEIETALEQLQKKYDRQISDLDHKKEYLQNEIDRLEANNEGVSKQYYTKQIELENQKLELYKKEREELVALLSQTAKGSDEWYEVRDAIFSVENATQESTLAMVELRKSIADLYKQAFDELDQAHGELEDLYSDRETYIEKYAELMDLEGKPKTAGMYISLMNQESEKLANSMAELVDLEDALNAGLASGDIKKGDENWIAMESSIRDTEAAILDSKVALAQYKEELKQLKVEAFELVRSAFSNKNDYYSAQQDYINEYISYLEAQDIEAPEEIYQKLIEIEQTKKANAISNLNDARAGLAKIEAAGYGAADEEWVNAKNTIVELEKSILESDTAMAEWNKTIQEMDFSKFDKFLEKLERLTGEIDNVYSLFSDSDVAFEDGSWTKEGITALSMLYQKMEVSKNAIKKLGEEIDELNEKKNSEAGLTQEEEERLEDLTDKQWNYINNIKDARDSIVDMNEARIDAIEEGLNKEIEAYNELIDLKKEELESERNLYEFRKDIQKQTKDIAETERKIAALSGSSSAADKAEKRRLEAQLREQKESLDDTYYSKAKDSQMDALDKESEAYQKSADDYIELLREKLENIDQTINDTLSNVLANADVTLEQLNEKASEYGIQLSTYLTEPWINASAEAESTKLKVQQELGLALNEDGVLMFSESSTPLLIAPFTEGGLAVSEFKLVIQDSIDEIQAKVNDASSNLTQDLIFPWNNTSADGGPITTFSSTVESELSKAVSDSQTKAIDMENALTSPWENGQTAVHTWSEDVKNTINKTVEDAKEKLAEIEDEAKSVANNIDSIGNEKSTNEKSTKEKKDSGGGQTKEQAKNAAQAYINSHNMTEGDRNRWGQDPNFKKLLDAYIALGGKGTDLKGVTGTVKGVIRFKSVGALEKDLAVGSESYFNKKVTDINGVKYYMTNTGSYLPATRKKTRKNNRTGSYEVYFPKGTPEYTTYAKGTLGTKKDELAITDESWIGEEITLAANKSGQLQYLKKGSAVMPADISENLVEWGKLNPDTMNFTNPSTGVNVVSSAVNKPELNFAFDSLVHVDHCDEGTLSDLEKMVDTKINDFSKKLNYALKTKGAT